MDASERGTQSLSSEDLEPPELDLDLAAALIREKCCAVSSNQLARDDCLEDIDSHTDNEGKHADTTLIAQEPVSERRRGYQQASDKSNNSYVFDPVVGVILKETRDLWRESIKLYEQRLDSAILEKEHPDRSLMRGDELEPSAMTLSQKRHCLPPVRFSKLSTH